MKEMGINSITDNSVKGRIIASVAGDYSVECDDGGIVTCKARGLFRLKKISPCVGDYVTLSVEGANEYIISEIHERVNALVRPPLANLDCAVIVVSSCEPKPNALVIDRLSVIFDSKSVESIFVFTKTDKKEAHLFDVYQAAGFSCYYNTDTEVLRGYLQNKTSALIGNTGVGKTSLLNRLIPGLDRPTGEISKKLGRGKHTTRTVEFYRFQGAEASAKGYIADTPGFSTVETKLYGGIASGGVALHFREFMPLIGKCRFGGCTHTGEEGCAIIASVESGGIEESRFESYKAIYVEAKRAENEY